MSVAVAVGYGGVGFGLESYSRKKMCKVSLITKYNLTRTDRMMDKYISYSYFMSWGRFQWGMVG
jgi:hypothetical protein